MESQIVTAINQFLHLHENMGNLYCIRNNSGAFAVQPVNQPRRFMRFGRKGSSDFIVFFKGGRTMFLEVKTDTGKQNEAQVEFEDTIKKLGYEYQIVRSVMDVENIVKNQLRFQGA